MHAPTHILVAVILTKVFNWKRHRVLVLVLVAVLSLSGHALLDQLGVLTYSGIPDMADSLWVGYQLLMLMITITLLYLWWSECSWAISFSLLPDIERLIVLPQQLTGIVLPYYPRPYWHDLVRQGLSRIFPFSYLSLLPDWHLRPWAILPEGMLILLLWSLVKGLQHRRRNIHF